ncbi:hypothetical protein FJZ19_03150 [Candidatus Pacearchaeota archaeon]|nr:hypothetical protein [Candidatus Pacearchaeota archaeon]
MNKNILMLVFAILLAVAGINIACASTYSYIHQNGEIREYDYKGNQMIPFSKYVSSNNCLDELDKANSTNNKSVDIIFIDSGCGGRFAYNVINYILLNKNNLTVLYDSDASSLKMNSIKNFSKLFNLSSFKESDFPNKNSNVIFIGNSTRITNTLNNYNFSEGLGIIYVKEDEYITLSGSSDSELISSINILTNFYNDYIQGKKCIIFRGCGAPDLIKFPPNLKEILWYSSEWKKGNIDLKSAIKKIRQWI